MADGLFDRITGGVETLFGGRTDPRISPEANRAATSDALINAGLGAIVSTGEGGFGATALEKIAQGAIVGRATGAQSRETARADVEQQKLQDLVDSGQIDQELLQNMFTQSIISGNTDAARALSEVIKSQNTASRAAIRTETRSQFVPEVGANMDILFDKDTGEQLRVLGRSALTGAGLGPPASMTHFDDELQRMVRSRVGPDGRPAEFLAFVDSGKAAGVSAEEQESKAQLIRDTAERLDLIDEETRGILPTLVARGPAFIKEGANILLSANWSPFKNQAAQDATIEALNFINVVINYLSGKQMTEQETRRYWTALIAGPGDSDESVATKSRARAVMVEAINSGRWEAQKDEDGNWIYQNPDVTLQQILAEVTPVQTDDSGQPIPGFGHLVPGD
jgi:hypothetical protein